jgi:2-polyprenyl-3-methyl-5-hydroxy-6-metoxy-1,4-benzoquinol methylase
MSRELPRNFYDQLSSDYHLIYQDWKESVRKQGRILDEIIRKKADTSHKTVLDCSCGIGTQTIGLGLLGYRVHGTDISAKAIKRAINEARSFGIKASFDVADLRSLEKEVKGIFDIVLSCDNSLPHLLTDEDLLDAAGNMRSKVRSGGLLIISIRDYDQILENKPQSTKPQVFNDSDGRRVVFQVWDWLDDGHCYNLNLFILVEIEGKWKTNHFISQYRALRRHELDEILIKAGFINIEWHMPDESGYFQPILTAVNS